MLVDGVGFDPLQYDFWLHSTPASEKACAQYPYPPLDWQQHVAPLPHFPLHSEWSDVDFLAAIRLSLFSKIQFARRVLFVIFMVSSSFVLA